MEKSLFFIWLLLVFLGSLLGILFTYLVTTNWWCTSINTLNQGSLYLISISFASAMIADLFSSLIVDTKAFSKDTTITEILFFENKIIVIVVFIFLIAVMASSYAGLLNEETPSFTIYTLQICSYCLTMLLGIYTFGLKYSYLHESDMLEMIQFEVMDMKQSNKKKDSKGRKLQ